MRKHVARAGELVRTTGYARRAREVAWLEREIAVNQTEGRRPVR
jgi:hypothetical protein